jgi:hypothetical protein
VNAELPAAEKADFASSRGRGKVWRICKTIRTTLLVALLAITVAGFFLNKIGLPEFAKRRIVAQLREKGWEVQFSRLRLRWYRGLLAEHLELHRTNQMNGPHLFVDEAQCRLNHHALRSLNFQVDSLMLRAGRLLWPLTASNAPDQIVVVNNIGGEMLFRANDFWELRSFHAEFLGIDFSLAGTLTNASLVRDWTFPRAPRTTRARTEAAWHKLMRAAAQLHFSGKHELRVQVQGDAGNFKNLTALLKLDLERLESPWLAGTASPTA